MKASDREQLLKLQAIRCHATQLTLSKKRFLGYVSRPELFSDWQAGKEPWMIVSFSQSQECPNSLHLKIRIPIMSRALLAPTLLLRRPRSPRAIALGRFQLSTNVGELKVPLFFAGSARFF